MGASALCRNGVDPREAMMPVVAGIEASHRSGCIELPTQLAGALGSGQATGIVKKEAKGAGTASGTDVHALHPRVLCQTQPRARTPLLLTLVC